ncbi:MAG: Gfo/Idh/MocA family protein [Verrucomicrobiales bacterium]
MKPVIPPSTQPVTTPGNSRRKFLTKGAMAASAVALPYFVPASALGRDGTVAPSNRIVMGGIGIGGQGSRDLSRFLGHQDVQFVAICDVRKSQRDAGKSAVDARNGNTDCALYTDMLQLLSERSDVEAVLIATGDRWHALASVLAMRAGKDVYCEKPSCLSMEQGRKLVETARDQKRVFQTGAQRLSESHHVFAIEMARLGHLGKLQAAYADCRWRGGYRVDNLPAETMLPKTDLDWDQWLGPVPDRPYNGQYVTGEWYNFECMATDIAQWGSHTVAQVLAALDAEKINSIEFKFAGPTVSMVTKLSTGLELLLYRKEGSVWDPCEYWTGACGERFVGEKGWVGAADGYAKPDVSSPELLKDYRKILSEYTERTQRPMDHVRDFLNCVRTRSTTVGNPDMVLRSMAICLAADICNKLGRDLKLDLSKMEFINDPEANSLAKRDMRAPFTF